MSASAALAMPPPLLPLVAAGDEGAMRQLMRHFTPLVRSVGRRVNASGSTDDLVQETMVRLWRFAHRFDPRQGSEPTFVATVARNAAIDMARREARRPAVATADTDAVAPAEPSAADQVANVMTVRAALTTLPPRQREILRLAYFEQLTQQEIAERLDIPVGTVKSRTFQAMRALRSSLADA
jgi:RNA polymerase sigma-70 factor, ECF subfamily